MKAFKLANARGQSLLEFVLALPLFMILIFGVVEWGQTFVRHMRGSSLSREAVLAVRHECVDIDPQQEETHLECLNRIRGEFLQKASLLFPDFAGRGDIILSLWGQIDEVSTSGNFVTRVQKSDIDADVLTAMETVAVGEFFYNNQPVTPLSGFINFVLPALIYKPTFC